MIEYRVSLAQRSAHLFEVEARFPVENRPAIDLRLPIWTPGSYLIREYQRHLQDLLCTDEAGRTLRTTKVEKAAWRVATQGSLILIARYRIYAHEVTVRTAHLDETHAFWNGACLFLYVEELRDRSIELRIEVPDGWRVSTALDAAAGSWTCRDYDTLVDSPCEVGPHSIVEFSAAGRPHTLTVWGRTASGPYDLERLRADLVKIAEAQAALFDGLPYDRYAFLLHLVPGAHGGLEHASSSTLLASPFDFCSEKKYTDLLELVSHELFHCWNIKRIRPAALERFDYQREALTRSLWVIEGWTSYYDRLLLRRAGLVSAKSYLATVADKFGRIAATPGRLHQSLEQASFDAWIKFYRPDENTANSAVSYYLKGSLVALLLDLEIRRRTRGARSLDDALRALWSEYGRSGHAYPDEAVQPLCERVSGVSLDDLWSRWVRSCEELDATDAFAFVGLTLRPARSDEPSGGWLGANLRQEGERLRVVEVRADGPALVGGLCPGDQILACDGFRVDEASLKEHIAVRRPGDLVELTLFRRDQLAPARIALGALPASKWEIVPIENAPPEARDAFQSWLSEPWESLA